MVFSSNIFLFLFLPLVILLHQLVPKRLRNTYLFAVSGLFYAWGSGWIIILLFASALVSWAIGLAMEKAPPGRKKLLLAAAVIFNLALLVYFKYTNFFYDQAAAVFAWFGVALPPIAKILLPLGISFFTFQKITYAVEIYRGEAPALSNPIDVGMYWALFPHLIAGPIIRYSVISDQIRDREVTLEGFFEGIWMFCLGLGKKVLLANTIGEVADRIFGLPPGELDWRIAWLGAVCYTFQIYYDFSGYSDMAIGLAAMFGFKFPENFRQPYRATTVREFWRRWHITLTDFFRDFVYIPLGGNRLGPTRTYINLVTVFFLTGLWHGAAWTFIFWGLWHGAFIMIDRGAIPRLPRFPGRALLGWLWTFVVVIIGWVFFRIETVEGGTLFVARMFTPGPADTFQYFDFSYFMRPELVFCLGVGSIFAFVPLEWFDPLRREHPAALAARSAAALGLLAVCAIYLSVASFNPFIYFRF